jgi:hypothetical protein
MRRPKQEILDLFRACAAKLGGSPGMVRFCKLARLKPAEVKYYWPRLSDLVREAGATPKSFQARLPDDEVFQEYAKVCLHLGKVPTDAERRIAQRELKTKTHTVTTRFGSQAAFDRGFRSWLEAAPSEFRKILDYPGWNRAARAPTRVRSSDTATAAAPLLHHFLPGCLQYLDALARGEPFPGYAGQEDVNTEFERRVADAFRCLGFDVQSLGQGTGRKADALAIARQERYAVIVDAKVRKQGYVLGTEDRKFLEYATTHGGELQRDGVERVYLAVVGPAFRDSDLQKLTQYLASSPVRGVVMITASALMRWVEDSIRNRSSFRLGDLEKLFFGQRIVAA